jgi:hypothetical protein
MKRIYVVFPNTGDIERNSEYVKNACRFVMEQGHAFFCPHLLCPNILKESNSTERQLSLDMGIAMLRNCDALWRFGERFSQGMMAEIEETQRLSICSRREMEKEQSFYVGMVKNNAPRLEMGTL